MVVAVLVVAVVVLVVAVVVLAVATMGVVARGSPFAVKGMVRPMLPMWKNLSSKKERERLLKATMLIPFSGMTLRQIRALGLDCGKRQGRLAGPDQSRGPGPGPAGPPAG